MLVLYGQGGVGEKLLGALWQLYLAVLDLT